MSNRMSKSKPLGSPDVSGSEFSKEMLRGDPTYGINFDRIQWDNNANCYVIIEYLLCEESQSERGITPYSSHPKRYFQMNSQKFIALWDLTRRLKAKLYLVNYAKSGTKFADEVLLMDVQYVDPEKNPTVMTENTRLSRSEFSAWLRDQNKRGRHNGKSQSDHVD